MKSRPNIVLILAEDLDFEGINCCNQNLTGYSGLVNARNKHAYENYEITSRLLTPTIDFLASNGVLFNNYYCTSAICTPSRYTVLTGRYAQRSSQHALEFNDGPSTVWFNSPIYPQDTLLPKSLKQSGYTTGFFGKWHNFPDDIQEELNKRYYSFPKDSSWDNPIAQKGVTEGYEYAVSYLKNNDFGFDVVDRVYFNNPEPFIPQCISSHNIDWIIEGADKYIRDQKDSENPFFAYIALTVPHSRYSKDRFNGLNELSSAGGMLDERPSILPTKEKIKKRIKAAGMDESACEGLWVDEAVKAIMKAVNQIGKAENTCFIFTTDHPTAGKGSCHLGRIPLIMYWPEHIEGGDVCSSLLSQTDLAPTLLDIAKCTAPEDMKIDGSSFLSMINTPDTSIRDSVYIEVVNSRAVVCGKYKYIANRFPNRKEREDEYLGLAGWLAGYEVGAKNVKWSADKIFPNYFDTDQLYDIEIDPLEQHNLISDPKLKDIVATMRKNLTYELSKFPHRFGEFT